MKPLKIVLSFITMAVVVSVSGFVSFAIGFTAEEAYESVFVIYSGDSLGSGFAVGKDCIVTNAHVISDPGHVVIKTYGGEQYSAYVIGMDKEQDIAVLGVADTEFSYLPAADPAGMNIGDDVYAIGAPKSMSYTLTKGVISAKERQIGNYSYIQIDAAINEGNSGGPLLDDSGRVIGMNTLKLSDSEGIGMAIPIKSVCMYLETLDIELNETGNVSGEIPAPSEGESALKPGLPEEKKTEDNGKGNISIPLITKAALAAAGISIIGNIVLVVLLVYQKRKNLVLKCDPSERTDFDIDILE